MSSLTGIQRISGGEWGNYGHVLVTLDIRDHSEARLMEAVIHQAMREMAGNRLAEPTLARWSKSLAEYRRRAVSEKWHGWENTDD